MAKATSSRARVMARERSSRARVMVKAHILGLE